MLTIIGFISPDLADFELGEWLRNPFSHFQIRANEGI